LIPIGSTIFRNAIDAAAQQREAGQAAAPKPVSNGSRRAI